METYAAVIERLEKTPNQSPSFQEAVQCCKNLLSDYQRALTHNKEMRQAAKGMFDLAFDPTK